MQTFFAPGLTVLVLDRRPRDKHYNAEQTARRPVRASDVRVWPRPRDRHLPPTLLIQCKRQKDKVEKVVVKALWADVQAESAKSGLLALLALLAILTSWTQNLRISMPNTMFYSWQADTPTRTGRNFIREVLDDVCKRIASGADIDEALRDLAVDSDTQNVAGQPPIVATIFQKIDASSVFVGDMTFVGKRLNGRPTPNPNVLIEYGWALKAKTSERLICLMNVAHGNPSETTLPFNLRHVRWPITFDLQDDVSAATKAKVMSQLVVTLEKAIRASLATIPVTDQNQPRSFPEAEVKDPPSRFRAKGEPLGMVDDTPWESSRELFLADGPVAWLRVIPTFDPGKKWPISQLMTLAMAAPHNLRPLVSRSGWSPFRAEDGAGVYRDSNRSDAQPQADSVTFVFDTGEIWSIESSLVRRDSKHISQEVLEGAFSQGLSQYSQFLRTLGVDPPYKWRAGIYGIRGRHLVYPPPPGKMWLSDKGPVCAANLIEMAGEYDGQQSPASALMPFFSEIFEKSGRPRPEYLPQ